MIAGTRQFAARVTEWQRRSGRSDLPWQGTRDPYRIWLSEVMLQQTQVATAIPYYSRFLERFPDLQALGKASLDEVLQLWSGLGYYSRGRNLHAAAVRLVGEHGGAFPSDRESLQSLPGVGRSTAAAIAVFSGGAREAILDGNVKRVLARCFAVEGFPGNAAVQEKLWTLAESLLPVTGIEAYTQGLMDLGATVCTRSRPSCNRCPLVRDCEAHRLGIWGELPTPKPRKELPRRRTVMLIVLHKGKVLLQKRPPSGIWGGLWSLPEFVSRSDALRGFAGSSGPLMESRHKLATLDHTFTHYRLTISPILCLPHPGRTTNVAGSAWWPLQAAIDTSIPAPVRTLLRSVRELSLC